MISKSQEQRYFYFLDYVLNKNYLTNNLLAIYLPNVLYYTQYFHSTDTLPNKIPV